MSGSSLLNCVASPIVIGDPDGCAVYANPAFESAFEGSGSAARGTALAELFDGGAREAVLQAVARVCSGEGATHFRLREGQVGYAALASPIEAESGRVGVLILLTEETRLTDLDPRLRRDFEEPLEELEQHLSELAKAVGGRRDSRHVVTIEDAASALQRLRKRLEAWGAPPRRR